MRFYRFQQILCALHFVNEEAAEETGKSDKKSPNFDRLYKVREYWETLYDSFYEGRAPARTISIDEEMIGFRGRCPFRVKMPNKPTHKKYGMKVLSQTQ